MKRNVIALVFAALLVVIGTAAPLSEKAPGGLKKRNQEIGWGDSDPLVGTTWNFLKSNKGKINEFTFRGDGTVECENSYPDAMWQRLEEDTILFWYGIHAYIVFHTKEEDRGFMWGFHSISGASRYLRKAP